MHLIFVFLFALSPFGYQQLPDAATLTKEFAAGAKFRTLQSTSEMTMQIKSGNLPTIKTTTKSTMYRSNPGKTRVESESVPAGPVVTVVSNGEFTWTYSPALKQFMKTSSALGPLGLFAGAGAPNLTEYLSAFTNAAKVVREETVEVDGKARSCWVVETRLGSLPVPAQQNAVVNDAVMTTWMDKQAGLTLRTTMSMKLKLSTSPSPAEIEMNLKVTSFKIDEPLADSIFDFVPPPDAKEVTSLSALVTPPRPDLSGKDAPAFDVKALDGTAYSLASLKGKPILLDFWASWCGPCRQAMPALESMNRDYKGLVILGIDSGEDRETVEKFLKTTPASYPTVLSIDSDIMTKYQITAFPTYVLIDSAGKVLAHQIGYSGEANLRSMLGKAGFDAPPAPAVSRPVDVASPPSVLSRVEPTYTREAAKAGNVGSVTLEAIVRADGTVDVLRVVKSLDPGLDQNAVEALKQWRFRPGMRNGKPVDVHLNIVVNFNLGAAPAKIDNK
jgi:TonB family protein